jgi:uncharacterized coiled-coil protein SlyX
MQQTSTISQQTAAIGALQKSIAESALSISALAADIKQTSDRLASTAAIQASQTEKIGSLSDTIQQISSAVNSGSAKIDIIMNQLQLIRAFQHLDRGSLDTHKTFLLSLDQSQKDNPFLENSYYFGRSYG